MLFTSSYKRLCAHITAVLLLLSVLLFTASCGDKTPGSTEEELTAALHIGDYDVPYEQYRYFFLNYKNEYDGEPTAEDYEKIKADTETALLSCYAKIALCEQHGIDPYGKDVNKAVDRQVSEYISEDFGSEEAYYENLSGVYMNDSVFRFVMRVFECESRLYDKLIESGDIKSDDNTFMDAVNGGEFCHAKQILIMNDEGEDAEENRALAEQALMNAQLGMDFDALIAKYGEDPEMITNPVGYYFTHNELIEEFEDAAFALEVGQISEIVESHLGYHIIQRCEIDLNYVVENSESLKEAYLIWKYQELVEDYGESMKISEAELFRGLKPADIKIETTAVQ